MYVGDDYALIILLLHIICESFPAVIAAFTTTFAH